MTDFAKILKQTLDERGISQKWLADAADTKEATISRYITGTNKSPNVDILISIAKALNVSTDYLLGISEVPNIKSDLTPTERIMLAAFRRASERDAGIVLHILDSYMSPNEKGFLQQSEQINSEQTG